jgi:hypothetical protein
MVCKNVVPFLSEFFDGVLDADTAVQVSQHLSRCTRCRNELDGIAALHGKLRSLEKIPAPDYLSSLVEHKIAEAYTDSWPRNLQNSLERRWSIIRTTGRMWYVSRALGTAMTALFFCLIPMSSLPPLYIEAPAEAMERDAIPPLAPAYLHEVGQSFRAQIGMLEAPKRVVKSDPALNYLYLSDMAEKVSRTGNEEDFWLLTSVDSDGSSKIKGVQGSPSDQSVLRKVNYVIKQARWRPASENGKPVSSYVVFLFDNIKVYPRLGS